MRVPTASAYDRSIDAIQQRRAEISRIQDQLSSGRRVNSLSDDPASAAQAERLRSQTAKMDTDRRMVEFAKQALSQAEGAVGSAVSELQSVRETLLQAGNGTLVASDRAALAQQLRGSYDQLLSIANSSDGSGGYIFGGAGTTTAPFSTAATVVYNPQGAEQTTATDPSLAISQNGYDSFMNLPTAGGPTSVFTVLADAITLLQDPNATPAALQSGIKTAIDGTDAGLNQLQVKRSAIGESLRLIDSQEQSIDSSTLNLKAHLSDLIDVDYPKVVTELATNQTALDAALKTYAQISKMSLFDYL